MQNFLQQMVSVKLFCNYFTQTVCTQTKREECCCSCNSMQCVKHARMQLFSDPYFLVYRSSHQRFSVNKGVLRNFAKFTGKHHEFIKMRLQHRCLPVNFAKFLRTSFLQNTSERLLLCMRTESTIPFLYGKIWIRENSYSGMFLSVLVKIREPERAVS